MQLKFFVFVISLTLNISCVFGYVTNFIDENPQYQSYPKKAKMYDYSNDETIIKNLKRKWKKGKDLRIRFFGDSHIAGDFISSELRSLIGNINAAGFSYPIIPPYHQTLLLNYESENFALLDSRKPTPTIDYPMGGIIAFAESLPAFIKIDLNYKEFNVRNPTFITQIVFKSSDTQPVFMIEDSNQQTFSLQASKENVWEIANLKLKFPITIHAMSQNGMLGGYFITKDNEMNVVDHVGINGVRSDFWLKWNADIFKEELGLLQEDIIVLCYGSNDAMYDTIHVDKFMQNYHDFITLLRESNPNALIVLMSPPPVMILSGSSKNKYKLAKLFQTIQDLTKQVAQTEHTLYFDSDEFITATGSKQEWIKHNLSKTDVHLTPAGYRLIAHGIYQSLTTLLHSHK